MATEKETLQEKAEDLGLDTEGTIAQLKDSIAAAEAEATAAPSEPPPEEGAATPVADGSGTAAVAGRFKMPSRGAGVDESPRRLSSSADEAALPVTHVGTHAWWVRV